MAVDYSALAKQYGGASTSQGSSNSNYAALAAQSGGSQSKKFSPDNPYAAALNLAAIPTAGAFGGVQAVGDFLNNTKNAVIGGAQQLVGGLHDLGQGGEMIADKMGAKPMQGDPYNNPQGNNQSFNFGDIGKTLLKGAGDVLGGGMQAGFAPQGAAIESAPDFVKTPVKAVIGLPGTITGKATETIGNLLGVDTSTPDFQQHFVQPMQNIVNAYLAANPDALKNAAGKVKENVSNMIKSNALEAPTETTPSPQIDQKKLEGNLLKAGVPEAYVNRLGQLSQENPDHLQTFQDYMKAGLERSNSINPENTPRVLDLPGKEVEDFYNKAKTKLNNIGKLQDAAKDNLRGQTIDTAPLQSKFQDVIKKLNLDQIDQDGNVYKPGEAVAAGSNFDVAKTKLSFNKSELKGGGPALEQLQSIWQDIQDNPKMDARDAEALTGQIDNITGQLKEAGIKSTLANRTLGDLKTTINQTVGGVDKNFGDLNTQYATLIKNLQPIENAITSKLKGGDTVVSGSKLLDNLLKSDPAKAQAAMDAMQNIENDHGIKVPQDLGTEATLADMAEKLTGASQGRSMQGIMDATTKVARAVPGGRAVGRAYKAVKAVEAQVNPDVLRTTQKSISNINNIIDKANSPGGPVLSPEHISALQDAIKTISLFGGATQQSQSNNKE